MIIGAVIIPNIQMGSLRLGEVGDSPVVPAGREGEPGSLCGLLDSISCCYNTRQTALVRKTACKCTDGARGILVGDIHANR